MYNVIVSSNFSLMHALVWPFKLKLLPSCFYHWYDRDIIGSWSNDDGDINENRKKAISVDWQNNSSARASHFFSTFFAITAQLRCENASYFHVLWKTWTQHNDFLFLFLNFDTVFWTRWNMRDKVWSWVTLLFKWHFHSHRCHCCLNSLKNHVDAKWQGWPMQVPILPISTLLKLSLSPFPTFVWSHQPIFVQ